MGVNDLPELPYGQPPADSQQLPRGLRPEENKPQQLSRGMRPKNTQPVADKGQEILKSCNPSQDSQEYKPVARRLRNLGQGYESLGQARREMKVHAAINAVLLQTAVPPEGQDVESWKAHVWELATELTRAVVTGKIESHQGSGFQTMEPGQTYKVRDYKIPFSIEHHEDGSMVIKLKPGKGSLGIKALGAGEFGKVTRAIQINADAVQLVAYKSGLKEKNSNDMRMNELAKGCKNVVQMHNVREYTGSFSLKSGKQENVEKVGMILEFCNGGDLLGLLPNGAFYKLPEADQLRLFREILVGVKELHDRGIVHLDLKPANIMLVREEDKLHARIGDLGTAGLANDVLSPRGTKGFWAPEVDRLVESKATEMSPTPAMDCYSLGAIANLLFSYSANENGGVRSKTQVPSTIKSMINGLRAADPSKRVGVEDALRLVDQRLRELS